MKGDFASAESTYQEALRLQPENPDVLKRLGIVEQTELKFGDSVAHLKAALAADKNYPEANFFLGVSYLGLNELPAAIQSFQNELKTQNPHPRSRYYLGMAYESAGHMEDAISQFNASLAANPKDADSLYQLARIYKSASVEAIDRLRSLDPDSFQLHSLQGELDAEEEKYPDAITEYQAALAKRPDATGIHYAIGVAYWAQNIIEPAKKAFQQALKESPNDPLTNLYLADISVRDEEYENALQYLKVAAAGQADPFRVHMLLGKCYRGQHQPEKAKAEFQDAIQENPTVPEAHYLLAQVFQELKDRPASDKEFAEFQRLSQASEEKSIGNKPQNR